MIEIDDELADRVRAEFGEMMQEAETTGEPLVVEQPRPQRRGRFPYLRNPDGSYQLGEDGKPVKDTSRQSSPVRSSVVRSPNTPYNPLPAAPLTKYEEKQVAERLQNILQGMTGVVGVANPVFEMTEDEAKAIAEPLSSYLIRMQPTSKVAKQILDEYDLVAVATGSAAYGVRVYKDLKKERDAVKHVAANQEPLDKRAITGPSPVDDGRSDPGIEKPTRQIRPIGEGHNPVMPGDGPISGF
jgi:hypothetical protein